MCVCVDIRTCTSNIALSPLFQVSSRRALNTVKLIVKYANAATVPTSST